MLILGLNKTTLLDYPGRVAATVFTGGCNFRCPFCHNGNLVLKPALQEAYSEEEVLSFLEKRRNLLKGVCITGGEPTLQADLVEFILKIKNLGYAVKLDTNGYEPAVLKELLLKGLLDYVAMDVKNCPEKYERTAGKENFRIEKIEKSMALLKKSEIDYEFRTTVVRELHEKDDILKIGEWIAGCPHYFLQQYQDNENVMCALAKGQTESFHGYDKVEMKELAEALENISGMTGKVSLRGL